MKNFKLLGLAICFFSLFVLMGLVGKANAGWWGFSSLNFDWTTEGNANDIVTFDFVSVDVTGGCWNGSKVECHSGVGNTAGFEQFINPTFTEIVVNEKKFVSFSYSFDLDFVNIHTDNYCESPDDPDPDCHLHICYPYDSQKEEIEGSIIIPHFTVVYWIENVKNGKPNKTKYMDVCTWDGLKDGNGDGFEDGIDPETCIALDNSGIEELDGAYEFSCTTTEITE